MYISTINIKNYRLFPARGFVVENINIPDGRNKGSGITVFVGENGCGKTSLLEAISLPLLSYKSEGFSLDDINDQGQKTKIEISADREFEVDKVVRGTFKAKGFLFDGGVRSRGTNLYLTPPIICNQKYIQADSESIAEDSSDLRVNVNNPWKGTRFTKNDVLFLDKNRTYQIRSGTYNQTRFDRLMEDFNFQYIKAKGEDLEDISSDLHDEIIDSVQSEFFKKAVDKFQEISGIPISLELINNYQPFNGAFMAEKKSNKLQIEINKLGSGYEMLFSLLYSFYLSQQSNKDLIILLDEPELHLHPKLQESVVKVLLEIAKTSQVILTSQSPLLVKYLSSNKHVRFFILNKSEDTVELSETEARVLPSLSANEINYIAFKLPSQEYHNELYGYLHELYVNNGSEEERGQRSSIASFDNYLVEEFACETILWKRHSLEDGSIIEENRTIHTCIRNKRHHPDNTLNDNDIDFLGNLEQSIVFLRKKIMR